jgi:hypothetical protein
MRADRGCGKHNLASATCHPARNLDGGRIDLLGVRNILGDSPGKIRFRQIDCRLHLSKLAVPSEREHVPGVHDSGRPRAVHRFRGSRRCCFSYTIRWSQFWRAWLSVDGIYLLRATYTSTTTSLLGVIGEICESKQARNYGIRHSRRRLRFWAASVACALMDETAACRPRITGRIV